MKKIIIFLVTAASLVACSKDHDNGNSTGNALIRIKKSQSSVETTSYKHDNSGRVIESISNGVNKISFEYYPTQLIEKLYNQNGNVNETRTGKLDANGLITEQTTTDDPNVIETWLYNSDKQMTKDTRIYPGGSSVMEYFYSNKNLDSIRYSTDGIWTATAHYTYHLDQPNVLGVDNFGQTFYGIGSKNMMKTFQFSFPGGGVDVMANISFEYDSKGRATKRISQKGATTNVITYTYE